MSEKSEVLVPRVFANDDIVYISRLFFSNGEKVQSGDEIVEVEAAKCVFSIEAHTDGFVWYCYDVGETCRIGDRIAEISEEPVRSVTINKGVLEIENSPVFSKKALILIKKNNIDKEIFNEKDFVREDDVRQYLNKILTAGNEQNKKHRMRFQEGNDVNVRTKALFLENNVISTVFVHMTVKNYIEKNKSHTNILARILNIVYKLLEKYKEFNAYFYNEDIRYHDSIRIGISIDAGYGLRVVHINDLHMNKVSITEKNILIMLRKYWKCQLCPEDWRELSFTVSDLGNENIDFFIPVVGQMQAATLGISRINAQSGEAIISLSFDHRIMSGRTAGQFLNELKYNFENGIEADEIT